MEIVYLGLFTKIFNWIYNKILAPVVEFVGNLLGTVLGWLFTNVLAPVLNTVLKLFFDWWLFQMKAIYSNFLLKITKLMLVIIDRLEEGLGYFIGTDSVMVDGESMSLLEAFIHMDVIRNAFLAMTVLGLGLALILTIYSVAKSAMDFDFENKRPVGAVLSSFLKCAIQFLTVPFLVLVIIKIAAIILQTIQTIFSANNGATLASTIFYVITANAAYNDSVRQQYLYNLNGKSYSNLILIGDFNILEIDYLVGIIVCIFMLIIMFSCILVFVKRLYEIALLYLASPLFVATMPLDDGEKFSKWREMFIAKCFTGFGSIVAMKLYLVIVPEIIATDKIQFGAYGASDEMTYFVKIVLLIGGAWTMLKAGPMITTLFNYQAGMDETQTARGATDFISQHVVAPVRGKVMGGLQRGLGMMRNGGKAGGIGGAALGAGKAGGTGQAFGGAGRRPTAAYPGLKGNKMAVSQSAAAYPGGKPSVGSLAARTGSISSVKSGAAAVGTSQFTQSAGTSSAPKVTLGTTEGTPHVTVSTGGTPHVSGSSAIGSNTHTTQTQSFSSTAHVMDTQSYSSTVHVADTQSAGGTTHITQPTIDTPTTVEPHIKTHIPKNESDDGSGKFGK